MGTRERVVPLAVAITVALGVAFAGSSADAKPSKKGPWVVKDLKNGKAIFAGWSSKRKDPSFKSLINKWGKPTTCKGNTKSLSATWKVPRAYVKAQKSVRDSVPKGSTLCKKTSMARITEIRTLGKNWRTDRGLAVGDLMEQDLHDRALYPASSDCAHGSPRYDPYDDWSPIIGERYTVVLIPREVDPLSGGCNELYGDRVIEGGVKAKFMTRAGDDALLYFFTNPWLDPYRIG